ncbi:MAG: helix-hairpin-helix domain-containing protein [Thermodesulfobacteriota bacterium]
MPNFSRSQLGVMLLLGAALLFLWAWRGHFGLHPSPPPIRTLHPVFVEVTGPGAKPGVYTFPSPPTLSQVLAQAGAKAPANLREEKLPSGNKVEVTADGQVRQGRMDGPRLLTLGLTLDLNRATAADLEALPGIGPALASRIVDYRRKHGYFEHLDDLMQVSGIGPKKLARLKPYLFIAGKGSD